jgi:dGTPase
MSATTSRYAYRLEIDPDIRKAARLYADLSREIVFCSPQIYQLEYKADFMLARLFDAFIEHYVRNGESRMVLLPTDTETYVRTEPDPLRRARRVCDYITGMTDGFAIRTYKRLFDPDFGSIVDLV